MIRVLLTVGLFLLLFQSCKGQPKAANIHNAPQPADIQNDVPRPHRANHIDSIQKLYQINKLLSKLDPPNSTFHVDNRVKFSDERCQKMSDSLGIESWTKADFDSNGLTDILLVGTMDEPSILCILDKGGHYEAKNITRRAFQECTFPVVKGNRILYYFESHLNRHAWDRPRSLEEAILIYKFGDFIEENNKVTAHAIEKIEYSTSGCYGECPIFDLEIHGDRTATWRADHFNEIGGKEVRGTFHTTLQPETYNEIINLINYIDFETLKDKYAVGWTDDQSSTLRIIYDSGKAKTIEDYGLLGTYGLDRVYQLLFKLRTDQTWVK